LLREWQRGYKLAAVDTPPCSAKHRRAFVATCIVTVFAWALVLSVSPRLHQRIHTDGNRSDHSCAVTLIALGGYHYAAQPPLISLPALPRQFAIVPALSSTWVRPFFLNAHCFAHAPPIFD